MSKSVSCVRAYGDSVCRGILPGAVLLLIGSLFGPAAFAQPAQTPPAVATQATAPQATAKMSPQQLDDLVAPVALYPDPLVAEVFAASTYPMELAEAQQWVRDHPKWKPSKLMDKAKKQKWDASVQGLVAFPQVLAELTQNMNWTTQLGNAFLAQQPDVMQAVQRMREQAEANGKLHSTPQVTVSNQDVAGQQEITIQPANPQVWYVPNYNPAYVWGPPVWGAYPSLWYPGVDLGFGWYPGVDLGLSFGGWDGWGWGGWGWGPNWYAGNIFVNPPFFNRYGFRHFATGRLPGNAAWMHNPEHRFGVPYANPEVARRFALNGGAANRMGVARGFSRFGRPGVEPRGFASGRNVFGGGVSRAPSGRGFSGMGAGRSFGGMGAGRSFGGMGAGRSFSGMRGGGFGGMRGGFGGGTHGGGRR